MSEGNIMNSYKHLKNVFNYNLNKMVEFCSIFCENPEKDFTRDRKLNFETTMRNVICMESGSLKDELLKLNDIGLKTVPFQYVHYFLLIEKTNNNQSFKTTQIFQKRIIMTSIIFCYKKGKIHESEYTHNRYSTFNSFIY